MGSRRNKKKRDRVDKAADRELTFGKFEGVKLRDAPGPYVRWCVENMKKGSDAHKMFSAEMLRRERVHDRDCYEKNAAARTAGKAFKVLTGSKASENRRLDSNVSAGADTGDGVEGTVSPWGVVYPEGWGDMTRGERSAWKKAASKRFVDKPLGAVVGMTLEQFQKARRAKHTSVKPAIPSAMDLADQQKRANVAMAAKTIRQPTEPIQAEECPY